MKQFVFLFIAFVIGMIAGGVITRNEFATKQAQIENVNAQKQDVLKECKMWSEIVANIGGYYRKRLIDEIGYQNVRPIDKKFEDKEMPEYLRKPLFRIEVKANY